MFLTINWRKKPTNALELCIFSPNLFIYLPHRHVSAIPSPSRDTHTTTHSNVKQNIFNILFIVLIHGKLKLKNTNVNNCNLENIHIVLSPNQPTTPHTPPPQSPKHVGAINK
jgi:GTPase SAR1 family protein